MGLLRSEPLGSKVLRHQMVQLCARAQSTKDGDTNNEDDSSIAGFICHVMAAWQVILVIFRTS